MEKLTKQEQTNNPPNPPNLISTIYKVFST